VIHINPIQKSYHHRRAIAMIELIFAIVIMGITLMSAPMLISTSAQSTYTSLQQESIAAAAVQINTIMSTEWDSNDANTTTGSPVLQTGSATIVNCIVDSYLPGVTAATGRYCNKTGFPVLAASAIGTEGTEGTYYDDVDDYNARAYTVSVYNAEAYTTTQGDYIDKNITVTSTVAYGSDQPRKNDNTPSIGGYDQQIRFSNPFRTFAAGTSNIKLISVVLTSTNAASELSSKNIRLSAFMCNIGAPAQLNKFYTNRP